MANGGGNDCPGSQRGISGVVLAVAVGLIVALDQATKVWAVAALADGPVDVVGDTVQLSLGSNPGAAFGILGGFTPLLALAAIFVALYLAYAVRRAHDPWVMAGLVLVLSGALGNLVDRAMRSPGFLRGEVVDFVKVGGFPVFNVADSAITVGVIILVVRSFRS